MSWPRAGWGESTPIIMDGARCRFASQRDRRHRCGVEHGLAGGGAQAIRSILIRIDDALDTAAIGVTMRETRRITTTHMRQGKQFDDGC